MEANMNDATTPPGKPAKPAKAAAEKKEPTVRRSKFEEMYPKDSAVTLNVKENPKKEGSAARERFQYYFSGKTVNDYLEAGGTFQDIAYDVGRQFIKVG
jgi:hypothetical protein